MKRWKTYLYPENLTGPVGWCEMSGVSERNEFITNKSEKKSSCLYRASMTIKTLYYPTDAQIYIS